MAIQSGRFGVVRFDLQSASNRRVVRSTLPRLLSLGRSVRKHPPVALRITTLQKAYDPFFWFVLKCMTHR